MADETTPVEGGQESLEPAPGAPRPTFASEASGDSGSSPDVSALASALKKELEPFIKDEVARSTQSTKDKRIAQIEKQLQNLPESLAEYEALREKHGPQEAARLIATDTRIAQLEQALAQAQTTSASNPQAGSQDWVTQERELLSDAGLTLNDPDVANLVTSKKWSNPDEYLLALRTLTAKKSLAPQPTPGSSPAPAGGTGAQPDLRAEFEKEKAKIPRGSVGHQQLIALRKKYYELGLTELLNEL